MHGDSSGTQTKEVRLPFEVRRPLQSNGSEDVAVGTSVCVFEKDL
jgi:hypothetical protein